MAESVLVFDQQFVEERVLRIETMTKHDVTQFVRSIAARLASSGARPRGRGSEHRVADGVRFESGSRHDAAANIRLDVNVVRDFEVVHNRFQNLSTSPFGAIRPMRCKRSTTLSSAWRSTSAAPGSGSGHSRLWFHRSRAFHQDLA